jgi:hypothetical protein
MPTVQPTQTPVSITRSAGRAAFIHITDNILANKNVTKALIEDGIRNISSLLSLQDNDIDELTHLDSDPNNPVTYSLRKGEKGLIKTFIHFVHYHDEIGNPIGDDWLSIDQDDFDQFRCNIKYTRCFASLAGLGRTTSPITSTAPTSTPKTSHSAPSPVTCSREVSSMIHSSTQH